MLVHGRVSACTGLFYSAVDNTSSPSPQSEKVENHAVNLCTRADMCVSVRYLGLRGEDGGWRVEGVGGYVCVERKGWRLYVCKCVSFFLLP